MLDTIGLVSTISVGIAVPISNTIPDKLLISITRSMGCTSIGEIVSTTLTNCSALVVFPDVSVTVHVTVVSPSGKNSGASLVNSSIAILSNAVGSNKMT